MRLFSLVAAVSAALVFSVHAAQAADADAAMQPSTNRVISHGDMRNVLQMPQSAMVLDLRRNSDYDKDTTTMPGARRLDPDKIAEW